jgi:hypothetical protein
MLIPVAVVVFILAVFGTLTVSVDEATVQATFGVGPIRKGIALADVSGFEVVRNRWYYGWGVRYFPGGWLYNVSGLSAVEFRLRDGRRVRIGTDEPEALREAVARVIGPSPPPTDADLASASRAARRYPRIVGGILLGVVVLLAAVMVTHLREPGVAVSAQGFSVRSGLYRVDISIAQIEQVSLEPAMPPVLGRPNGFALGGTLRGHFRVEGLGRVRLFVEYGAPPYVLVRASSGIVIVNFQDADRTRQLYAALSALVDAP